MDILKVKEVLSKAKYLKGRALSKQEMSDCIVGYKAMESMGIFNKPAPADRTEKFRRR
jgi:hypothetical protein